MSFIETSHSGSLHCHHTTLFFFVRNSNIVQVRLRTGYFIRYCVNPVVALYSVVDPRSWNSKFKIAAALTGLLQFFATPVAERQITLDEQVLGGFPLLFG